MFLLSREYGLPHLHCAPTLAMLCSALLSLVLTHCGIQAIHRLDRLTSGVLLLARSSHVASRMMKQIECNQVRKTYIARVRGRFPEYACPSFRCSASSSIFPNAPRSIPRGKITVRAPLVVASHATGKRSLAGDPAAEEVDKTASDKIKTAATVFERFRYS